MELHLVSSKLKGGQRVVKACLTTAAFIRGDRLTLAVDPGKLCVSA